MNTIETTDRDVITALIGELSELNMKLNREQNESLYLNLISRKSFLFGFDVEGDASPEEFSRYCIFVSLINKVLMEFGLHMGNNGYMYISDSVKIMIDQKNHDLRLKSDIYPLIAVKHHVKSQAAIEHSIRNALNAAYEDNIRCPGINKMGIFRKRPTNKQFMVYAADAVLRCVCESRVDRVS